MRLEPQSVYHLKLLPVLVVKLCDFEICVCEYADGDLPDVLVKFGDQIIILIQTLITLLSGLRF
jgi:hypothetical protein